MTGLPRLAVLGLDVASAAAMISLVDGGLEVTTFAAGPVPPEAEAALAAYGCADRVVGVAPGTLRLSTADPPAPPFTVHGARTDPPDDTDPDDPLGVFDAVVLTAHTERLLPAGPGSPRFGGVFDRRAVWAFHVTDPPELAGAQGRWIGEYLRGRYALPDPTAMDAAVAAATGRPRRGGAVRAALADLDRELRAGHARAGAAGYPVPRPPAPSPSPAPELSRG